MAVGVVMSMRPPTLVILPSGCKYILPGKSNPLKLGEREKREKKDVWGGGAGCKCENIESETHAHEHQCTHDRGVTWKKVF